MIVTAHSGCDQTPDNTLTSVRHALTLPVGAFEIDVHRRADDTLIIAHDTDPTAQYTGCPTLREVLTLAAAKPRIGINCDLKDAGLEQAVCALHHSVAPQNPLYLSGTVSPAVLQSASDTLQGAVVLLNAEEIVPRFYPRMLAGNAADCAREAAAACQSCGAHVVNVFYWCCPDPFLKELAAHGIEVSVWTVDQPETAQHFADRQVFNLTTRAPSLLLRTLH